MSEEYFYVCWAGKRSWRIELRGIDYTKSWYVRMHQSELIDSEYLDMVSALQNAVNKFQLENYADMTLKEFLERMFTLEPKDD